MNILAIDIGTSSIRGLLYNTEGQVRMKHQICHTPHYLAGTLVEQPPEDWKNGLYEIVCEAVSFCDVSGGSVDAISVTGQRSSITPVDLCGEPLCNAIMWQDKRNAEICEQLDVDGDFISSRTGARVNTVFSGSKIAWLRRYEPEIYARTYKMLTVPDYVAWLVTGQFRTDHTYGSRSLMMNIRTRAWDHELLRLLNVEENKLCELIPPGTVLGYATTDFAAVTGVQSGIPLISAGGDQQCAALGHGITHEGTVEITTGTGCFILAYSSSVPEHLRNDVICGAHSIPGRYVLECSMLTCSALYEWVGKTFYKGEQQVLSVMDKEAAESPAGANGCTVLPYFQGRGTPDWNSAATGAFTGLSMNTTRGDMTRGVLEGIACEAANNLEVLEGYLGRAKRIYLGGGLTKNSAFNQIQSDLYGKSIVRCSDSEQTALGAWVNAAVALGLYPTYDAALEAGRSGFSFEQYHPNPENSSIYAAVKQRITKLYSATLQQ